MCPVLTSHLTTDAARFSDSFLLAFLLPRLSVWPCTSSLTISGCSVSTVATCVSRSSLALRIVALPVLNCTCSRMTISSSVTRTRAGQPFFCGSALGLPFSCGQASTSSRRPSPSVSGGQPFWLGSLLATPLSSGQASSLSTIPSPSRSGGGSGQPFFAGSLLRTPAVSGQASSLS